MIRFFKKNKILFLLITMTILLLISSFFFYAILNNETKEIVTNNINSLLEGSRGKTLDYFSNHILIVILIWSFGISIIGIIIVLLLYSFQIFMYGFEICALFSTLGIKNIILIMLYLIPNTILSITTFLLTYYSISYSFYLFRFLFFHKNYNFKMITSRYLKVFLFSFLAIISSSILEHFIYPILQSIKL